MLSPWGDVYCLGKGLRVQPKCYSNVEDQPENCILALKPLDLPTQRGSARSNLPATLSFPPERLRRCAVKPCQLSAVSGVDLPGELKRQEPPLWCSHLFEDICSCSVSNLTRQWPDDCSFPAGCHLSNSVRECFAEINVLFHIPVPGCRGERANCRAEGEIATDLLILCLKNTASHDFAAVINTQPISLKPTPGAASKMKGVDPNFNKISPLATSKPIYIPLFINWQ